MAQLKKRALDTLAAEQALAAQNKTPRKGKKAKALPAPPVQHSTGLSGGPRPVIVGNAVNVVLLSSQPCHGLNGFVQMMTVGRKEILG